MIKTNTHKTRRDNMEKLNKVTIEISDELWEKSIGKLNKNPSKYDAHYKNLIIHLIDSVSRGYTTPWEAYEALEADYFPEYLTVRKSAYMHLI
jgi:ribosomal protein S17